MSRLQSTSKSLQKISFLALKLQRKKKQEDVKSLERHYNYKLKKIVESAKQKEKSYEKDRERSLFLDKKHTQSENIFRLKAQLDELDQRKKLSLKDSIFTHKVQKNKNLSIWEESIMIEGITQRRYKEQMHQRIQSQKHQIQQQNRRQFLHAKSLQRKKKKQKELMQNEMKKMSELRRQDKWNKQYSKLQEAQNEQEYKSTIFQKNLNKAIREYYRLSTS